MLRLSPHRKSARHGLIQRLDRAAGEINPYLGVVAIGLIVLYAVCVVLVALHLGDARRGAKTQARLPPGAMVQPKAPD